MERLPGEGPGDELLDEEDCERLEDHLEDEELLDDDSEVLEDDPWIQQQRMQKRRAETKFSIW